MAATIVMGTNFLTEFYTIFNMNTSEIGLIPSKGFQSLTEKPSWLYEFSTILLIILSSCGAIVLLFFCFRFLYNKGFFSRSTQYKPKKAEAIEIRVERLDSTRTNSRSNSIIGPIKRVFGARTWMNQVNNADKRISRN